MKPVFPMWKSLHHSLQLSEEIATELIRYLYCTGNSQL